MLQKLHYRSNYSASYVSYIFTENYKFKKTNKTNEGKNNYH